MMEELSGYHTTRRRRRCVGIVGVGGVLE